MATFVLSARIIKRSAGRSVTAAAAYRNASELVDERTGQTFDYTRRRGVVHSEILAPANTPEWMLDRGQLWNAVELVEKRRDAQLAREIQLSLPHELTAEQRLELVRSFVREEFVDRGMIADLAVHAPDRQGDQRNHHAHVLLTMREITGEGFGKKCRDWNADFGRSQDSGERYVTQASQVEQWREHWAQAINRELERYGHEARVDHRSLAAQGIDREPEPKMGPVATEMEREGRPSHAGDDRRAVQERNQERKALAGELAAIIAETLAVEGERLADIDLARLPGVDEAKAIQAGRQAPRAAATTHDRAGEEIAAGSPPEVKPLGKTAGEIRMAWSLTRTAEDFHEALEERGLILVHVSADEARASERASTFATAIERQNRPLKEGFAVVDQRGNVTRIDQRATGDQREEIDKRLGRIDPASLVSVAAAKEAMRDAARAAWIEQKQAERPLTAVEKDIAAAFSASQDGKGLAAELDRAGIGLARVTAGDVRAIDALGREEQLAFAVDPSHKTRHFPTLDIGELVAVTRFGDVHRLNPHRADAGAIEQRFAEAQPEPASVVEVRAAFEIMGEEKAAFRAELGAAFARQRAESTEARVAGAEAKAAEQDIRDIGRQVAADLGGLGDVAGDVAHGADRAAGGLVSGISKALNTLAGIFEGLFSAPTPAQQRAAKEATRQAEAAPAVETPAAAKQRVTDEDRRYEQLRSQLEQQLKADLEREKKQRENDDLPRGRER